LLLANPIVSVEQDSAAKQACRNMPDTAYIHEDEHGVKRVGRTRVMLDSVIAAFQQGHSAETIAQQYPALTLEEVYGAITYYLGNRTEVDQYLRSQDALWKQERDKADQRKSEVVARLREKAARSASAGEPGR
jgi:uncharacterized protein (DUF433 family)